MKRIQGFWRDTWWLWAMFIAFPVVMAAASSWFYLSVLPFLSVSFVSFVYFVYFVYFASVRYDEDENERC